MSRLIRAVFYSLSLEWVIAFLPLQVTMLCAQSIQLIWTPNEDQSISHYGVYRKPHMDSSFVLIDTVDHPDSTYIDKNIKWNSQYFYAVMAIDLDGNESGFSNVVDTLMSILTPVALPVFTARAQETDVILEWMAATDFNFVNAGIKFPTLAGL